MKDDECVQFLQCVLPRLAMRWPGFRKVRRQVCRRVERRLRELELPDTVAYRNFLDAHPSEWHRLDEFCRITISRFYRDRRVFDVLREHVLPRLATRAARQGQRMIRVWCAGCASGEEPYTLQLIWQLAVQPQFPQLAMQIIATDANSHMLLRARHGSYPRGSFKDFPQEWMPAAFDELKDEFVIHDRFRGDIRFEEQDIRRQQPDGPFNLICCRHLVFTYFDLPLQARMLQCMLDRLDEAGVLVTGKHESLPPSAAGKLELVEPHSGIYRQY